MVPNTLQMLAYWAGRTERIDLGSIVVVLPWWNPIRLAHEVAILDLLLAGHGSGSASAGACRGRSTTRSASPRRSRASGSRRRSTSSSWR
jgi:hypothetical protein